MDELDLNDVDITNTRRTLTMPVGSREMLAMESDMDDELDLSKPCEGLVGNKWVPCLHPPFYDAGSGLYGTYAISGSHAQHYWLPRAHIRNIRSPQYETHTMESLLPLAGEWVCKRSEEATVFPFEKITWDDVTIDGVTRTYRSLATNWLWATGPDKGKPVAKLLPSSEA